MRCTHCGTENEDSSRFCIGCGAALPGAGPTGTAGTTGATGAGPAGVPGPGGFPGTSMPPTPPAPRRGHGAVIAAVTAIVAVIAVTAVVLLWLIPSTSGGDASGSARTVDAGVSAVSGPQRGSAETSNMLADGAATIGVSSPGASGGNAGSNGNASSNSNAGPSGNASSNGNAGSSGGTGDTGLDGSSAGVGTSAFWGVWDTASKDEQEAQRAADQLRGEGFDARVATTDEWEKLNSEHWYAVTAGVFSSRDEAEAALVRMKAAGHTSAYVKYTGAYKG